MAYTTINDASAQFQTALYTGNGGTQSITFDGNSNLQPDFGWFKKRNNAENHALNNTSVGIQKFQSSNTSAVEQSQSQGNTDANDISSYDTDGFTFNAGGGAYNQSSNTYVCWAWKANGGTTSSNSSGSITSTVQANTTAGFSIVTYTGAGGNQTIAHGLGAVPNVIFIKRRDSVGDWASYHSVLGNTKYLRLNSTNAAGTQSTYFNDTTPTSTVFTVGSAGDVNQSSGTYVAYCFAPIQGYSKFGLYTGNGNATKGTFVYTGFKPAFVLVKRTDSTGEWIMMDNKRTDYTHANPVDQVLYADASTAEYSETQGVDFLSNGFKQKEAGAGWGNADGGTYFYMAFAQNPFVATNNVISLAR